MAQEIDISLDDLYHGIAGLTPSRCASYAEAASVCLENQGHSSPASMEVFVQTSQSTETKTINWSATHGRAARSWNDLQEATEDGACGIAALIWCKPKGLKMERSAKGTGIDYWLADDHDQLMQHSARLEVSGILSGSRSSVHTRVKQKLRQSERSAGTLPVTVVVVEFSQPLSWIAES